MHTAAVMQAIDKPTHFSLVDNDSNIGTPLSSLVSLHHLKASLALSLAGQRIGKAQMLQSLKQSVARTLALSEAT